MDKILELFEKSLAEYQAGIGKRDNLVGTGEIIAAEMRKQREQIIVLGRLLADSYAAQPSEAASPFLFQRLSAAMTIHEHPEVRDGEKKRLLTGLDTG